MRGWRGRDGGLRGCGRWESRGCGRRRGGFGWWGLLSGRGLCRSLGGRGSHRVNRLCCVNKVSPEIN